MTEEIKVLKGISKGGETYDIDAKYWNGESSIKTINGQSLFGSGDITIPDEVELIEISGDMLADEPIYTAAEVQAIIDAYNANKLIAIKCGARINFGKGWFIPNISIHTQSGGSQIFLSGILGNYYIEHRITFNTSAGTVSTIAMSLIDLSEIGGSSTYAYGTCDTAPDDDTKEVTLADTNFTVSTGSIVAVKFTYTNTVASTSLKLSVAGVTAQIKYLNTTFPSSQHWIAGSTVEFVYDGSAWQVFGTIKDNVGADTKVNQTLTSTNSSYPLLFSYTAGKSSTGADEARFSTGLKYNPLTQSLLFPAATSGKSVNIGLGTKPSSSINGLVLYNAGGSQSDADFINICAADVFIRKADGSMGGRIFAELNGNASTATTLETPRTINRMTFNGSANVSNYVVCSTAADIVAKEISIPNMTFGPDARIWIEFTNGNTYTGTLAAEVTHINGTTQTVLNFYGCKGQQLTGSGTAIHYKGIIFPAGVYEFVYYNFQLCFTGNYVSDKKPYIVVGSSVASANTPTIALNHTLHTVVDLNNPIAITFTVDDSSMVHDYSFEFRSGKTKPTVTFPSAWKWANGTAPTISANKTYHVSVVNNCAVIAEF